MNAGKPNLADVLFTNGLAPEIVLIETATFVDRDCLATDVNDRIASYEWELDGIVNPAIRTNGVPKTAEVDSDFVCMGKLPFEGLIFFKLDFLVFRLAAAFSVHLHDEGNGFVVARAEEPVDVDDACQRASREGSAAEAE